MRVKIYWLFAVLLMLICSTCFPEDDWQKSIREGENAYQKMKQVWLRSEEKYQNSLIAPLMTGGALFSLDGKSSGNVQLMCPGADPSIDILIQPSGTKDLSFITVAYDSNGDGRIDSHATFTGPISGVCADGFARCSPGSWNNCTFYRWTFDGVLRAEQVPQSLLTNCCCINSSCTSLPFTSYSKQVLQTVGSGVVSAIVRARPRLAVSSGEIYGMEIRYFSQNASRCTFSSQGKLFNYGFTDADSQFAFNLDLQTKTDQEIARQGTDPDSLYNLVKNMPSPDAERRVCNIVRSAYFDSTTCTVHTQTVDGCRELENDPDCRLEREVIYDLYGNSAVTYANFSPYPQSLAPTCKTLFDKAKALQCCMECRGNVCKTDGGCPVGPGGVCYSGHITSYEFVSDSKVAFSLDFRTLHGTCGKAASYRVCGTANIYAWYPAGDDDPWIEIRKDGKCEFCIHEHDTSGNKGFDGDVTTTGIQEVSGYVNDSGACDVITSFVFRVFVVLDSDKQKICHDWWRKTRTYVCRKSGLDIDLRREAKIDSTIHGTDTGAQYDDLVKINSVWTQKPDQFVPSRLETQPDCIPACKLRKWVEPAQATEDSTSRDYRLTSGHYQFIYRLCEDGTCPVKEGEEIVQNCSCINDFNRWISASEVFRISSIDEICSSGKKHRY